MVTKKAAGDKVGAKLKVRKDTIKDLDAKGKAGGVKGGGGNKVIIHGPTGPGGSA